jgi:aromatic ring-opening dioxygenase catalytic subunit (LigB family)
MLEEATTSGQYWEACGKEALKHNVKGIIIMGAHWECLNDKIEVATNPNPGKSPCPFVKPELYVDWKPNPDLATADRCISMLAEEGFNVSANPKFDWIHDTYMPLIRMFPDSSKCPPVTIISMNARHDPHFHVRMGATLRPLRHENYLLIGTGGAIHNLYRNEWRPMLFHRDTLAQVTPPETWAMDFRQAAEDAITQNTGPGLRSAMVRLMSHPKYRDAQATDDHFIPALFCAGAAGDWEDVGRKNILAAESWELTNMCNSQFTMGAYDTPLKAISSAA